MTMIPTRSPLNPIENLLADPWCPFTRLDSAEVTGSTNDPHVTLNLEPVDEDSEFTHQVEAVERKVEALIRETDFPLDAFRTAVENSWVTQKPSHARVDSVQVGRALDVIALAVLDEFEAYLTTTGYIADFTGIDFDDDYSPIVSFTNDDENDMSDESEVALCELFEKYATMFRADVWGGIAGRIIVMSHRHSITRRA